MKILFGYVFTYFFIFGVLFITSLLKRKLNCSDETSRKIVHIFVSFTWIIMIYFFGDSWHLIVPPATFVILNYLSYKKDTFKMIERKNKSKASLGTVYYPISMVILSILTIIDKRFIVPYGIGMFCMAFGDGLAPYFSQKYKSYEFKILGLKKTVSGTLTVFLCSLLVILAFTLCFNAPLSILAIIIISLSASILELIGTEGLDNLTLPIGTAILSYLFIIF